MSKASPLPRIGIYGSDEPAASVRTGCGLWPPGYAAAVATAGATPVVLEPPSRRRTWEDVLANLDGVVLAGTAETDPCPMEQERVCECCRERRLPLLAVDGGLHALNSAFGGTLYLDLPRERPEALQHRHPPEKGLRHAITVTPHTRLSSLYGDGEIVVNSEHRRAVNRVARGFVVSAIALDGVIEAIELDGDAWYAVGVQWQPASPSASGLDIQLFRGLVQASTTQRKPSRKRRQYAAA